MPNQDAEMVTGVIYTYEFSSCNRCRYSLVNLVCEDLSIKTFLSIRIGCLASSATLDRLQRDEKLCFYSRLLESVCH